MSSADHKTTVFRGKIVELCVETARLPNGRVAEFEIVRHPGGAAAVALDGAGRVCLLRQYRHVLGEWIWELPAGKRDGAESPLTTAQRELAEEAGVRAASWVALGPVISSPGVFTEVVHLFLARDLTAVASSVEPHEIFEVHWVPFADALGRAHGGEIRDGKTLIGLFRSQAVLHPS